MANVLGPLFSLQAAGTLAKTLCFKKGTRGYVCRKYAKPSGPPSDSQAAIRQQTGDLMKNWKTLSIEDQASWLPLALEDNLEPINSYLKYNYDRITKGLTTTNIYPPIETTKGDLTVNGEITPSNAKGEYDVAGTHDEQDFFKHRTLDYWVWWDDNDGIFYLTNTQAGLWNFTIHWEQDNGELSMPFDPGPGATGQAIVTDNRT